jgi:uncharacterized repeat protein (TIGR03803 family)
MKRESVHAALKCALAAIVVALILADPAQAANNYKILHNFLNNPASHPEAALVADSAGNLYGTAAASSGYCGCGAVFKLTHESNGRWSYSVIHRFKGPDGHNPLGSLILDSSGNLYGTTERGGTYDDGTVFELSPSGSRWKEKVLYSFGGTSNDVSAPLAAVISDTSGNLYGTASFGGTRFSQGGVFELKRSGKKWKESVIYNFMGASDGGDPMGDLIWDSVGNLYGTTYDGGAGSDKGVVFELTPSGNGDWTETVLWTFFGSNDGAYPTSGLIFDQAGNLYGTASSSDAFGTVFEVTPSNGGWTFNTLHDFENGDGAMPLGGVILDSAGNLYGTTQEGGDHFDGVIFKLSQSGNTWTETVLHSFGPTEGNEPSAGLITDSHGVLYGTAGFGGKNGYGDVFTIAP